MNSASIKLNKPPLQMIAMKTLKYIYRALSSSIMLSYVCVCLITVLYSYIGDHGIKTATVHNVLSLCDFTKVSPSVIEHDEARSVAGRFK